MIIAIVPAHNEEKTVGSVVRSLLLHVDRVVVVDDGSDDATAALARAAGATVISHALNRGQGAALETGHEYARQAGADYAVHFDADGQFLADEIPAALLALRQSDADMLFGSRFLSDHVKMPWFKKYILHPIARVVNAFFGSVSLSDAHNGFRILSKKALEHIVIEHDRMAHATEIPMQAKQRGLSYIEFPVTVVYREYGQRALAGLHIIKDLVLGKFIK